MSWKEWKYTSENEGVYQTVTGSLTYAAMSTRPDTTAALGSANQWRILEGYNVHLTLSEGNFDHGISLSGNIVTKVVLSGFHGSSLGWQRDNVDKPKWLCVSTMWRANQLNQQHAGHCCIIHHRSSSIGSSRELTLSLSVPHFLRLWQKWVCQSVQRHTGLTVVQTVRTQDTSVWPRKCLTDISAPDSLSTYIEDPLHIMQRPTHEYQRVCKPLELNLKLLNNFKFNSSGL